MCSELKQIKVNESGLWHQSPLSSQTNINIDCIHFAKVTYSKQCQGHPGSGCQITKRSWTLTSEAALAPLM